jgi:radical SAM superfamily enzyme YgiQ (UPF0313 family)
MRLLFISPNRLRLLVPPLPLGLASLVAAARGKHEIKVLDFMFAQDPEALVRRTVAEFDPEIIALSLRNIDNQDMRHPVCYFPDDKELMLLLREVSPAPVILGGSGFSIMAQPLMAYLEADFGVVGEGEESFLTFLSVYQSHRNWEEVPGLVWRQGESWRCNPVARIRDLETLPPPALEYFTPRLYHEVEGSAKLPGMIPVQSRRGCPMKCIYCTTPLLEGRRLRGWAPEKVAGWLAQWHEKWGLTRFYFVDNVFNCPPEYARRLCRAIKDLRLPLAWGCLINPAMPDPELFGLLKESGALMVQVGNESGSELILTNLGKGFGRDKVELTLKLLTAAGLSFSCFLMFGGP